MVILKTSYYSSSWQAVRDFLEANLTDPITGNKSSSRKWVYNRIPNVKGRNFEGYPFIVVSDSNISTEKTSFSVGKKERKIRHLITVYTYKSENTGTSPQLDTLSDELLAAVDSETALSSVGLNNADIADSPSDEITLFDEQVLTRAFGMISQSVLDVS